MLTWMQKLKANAILLGAGSVAGVVLGLLLGWKLWSPKQAKAETYAPQVIQADGSVELERKPQQQGEIKVPHILPKGSILEREVEVTIQPSASSVAQVPTTGSAPGAEPPQNIGAMKIPCPPVRLNISLVRMPDQSQRVVVSSPDGQVVGGVDIPVVPDKPAPRQFLWAAGASYNPQDKAYGVWVQRQLGPIIVGLDVAQVRYPAPLSRTTWATQIKAGLRF